MERAIPSEEFSTFSKSFETVFLPPIDYHFHFGFGSKS